MYKAALYSVIRDTWLHHVFNLQYKHIKNLETNANPIIKIIVLFKKLLLLQVKVYTHVCITKS